MYKKNMHLRSTIGFLTPGVGLVTLFIIFPILFVAWVSLHSGSMATPVSSMEFVGINNYIEIFTQKNFQKALLNTFGYSILNIIIILPLSIGIGIFLFNLALKGNHLTRTVLFLPYMIPIVAIAIVWGYLYSPQQGPLNQILSWFSLSPQSWLGSPQTALYSLILINVWQTLGYYTIIIIAGLTDIPRQYYEAASIDGANRFQKIIHITIPLLKRSIVFVLIVLTINTLQVFDPIYVLTQGGPSNSTNVVSYHMYNTAFNFGHAGLASAMSFVLFLIILLLTIL